VQSISLVAGASQTRAVTLLADELRSRQDGLPLCLARCLLVRQPLVHPTCRRCGRFVSIRDLIWVAINIRLMRCPSRRFDGHRSVNSDSHKTCEFSARKSCVENRSISGTSHAQRLSGTIGRMPDFAFGPLAEDNSRIDGQLIALSALGQQLPQCPANGFLASAAGCGCILWAGRCSGWWATELEWLEACNRGQADNDNQGQHHGILNGGGPIFRRQETLHLLPVRQYQAGWPY
jgi:hypothetical protein